MLVDKDNHTHQTFETLSQFIDMRQPEWNFNIILRRIDQLTDLGLYSLGTSLKATFPFLSEPISDKVFSHILNVYHFHSDPFNEKLSLDIRNALAQRNFKNEDDFMLYFDEQMNKLVSEGDNFQLLCSNYEQLLNKLVNQGDIH